MRRAFEKSDYLNVRVAKVGDELEFGCGGVNANMGGEVDPVYGAWEHSREVPVFLPDGAVVEFDNITDGKYPVKFVVRRRQRQMILELPLIDYTFFGQGKPLIVKEIPHV